MIAMVNTSHARRCPICGKRVRVRKDGLLAKHERGPVTPDERADAIMLALIGKRWSVSCRGSTSEKATP